MAPLEALKKYGTHTQSCASRLQPDRVTHGPCDCGLEEAIASAPVPFTDEESAAVVAAIDGELDFIEDEDASVTRELLCRARAKLLGHPIVAVTTIVEVYEAPMFSYIVWGGERTAIELGVDKPWGFFDGDAWDDGVDAEIGRRKMEATSSSVHRDDAVAPVDFSDDDAILAALRSGERLVKLPDSMESPHWRVYAPFEEA